MTISLELNNDDTKLFEQYAKKHNISLSELVRNAIIEKIEDEYDLECYEKAITEYNNNPKTYSFDEVLKELDLHEV